MHPPAAEAQSGSFPNLDLGAQINEANAVRGSSALPDASAAAETAMAAHDAPYLARIEKLEGEVRYDQDTGLLNKVGFLEEAEKVIKNLDPRDRLVVYCTDLDRFKAVNDELTHDAGNELIRITSTVLRNDFKRQSDRLSQVSRLHGDENAVLSLLKHDDEYLKRRPLTDLNEEARQQQQRLNADLEQALKGTIFERFEVRFSVGVAVYQPGDTPELLLSRADIDMFVNKSEGKLENLTPEDIERLNAHLPAIMEPLQKLGIRIPDFLARFLSLQPRESSFS